MTMKPFKPFKMPAPTIVLSNRQQKQFDKKGSVEVTYPVSCSYNGGIFLNPDGTLDYTWKNPKSKSYSGCSIPRPIIPQGCKLVSLGCGLQLNAAPPYATSLLMKA